MNYFQKKSELNACITMIFCNFAPDFAHSTSMRVPQYKV